MEKRISLADAVRAVLAEGDATSDIAFVCKVWGKYIDVEKWTIEDLMELSHIYQLPSPETIIVTRRRILHENFDKTKTDVAL